MTGSTEHGVWREQVAGTIIERRPPDPTLAAHLAECAECTDAWRQLSGASARLIAAARTLPLEADPPDQLRDRVLAARRRAETSILPPAGQPPAGHAPPAVVPARGSSGRGWFGRIAWGGGGALIGASAVFVLVVLGSSRVTPEVIPLSGSILAPAASGSLLLERLPDGNVHVELAMSGLPSSDAGHFYELWFVGDGGRVSAGTFRSDGSPIARAFTTAADLEAYPRIGITLEVDDGDPGASDQRVAGSG
ncbi:MAG: anti-sigma factor [Chloroflexota bacterium]